MRQRRPKDGLLHASSDISGSLRHTQLDVAGAPRRESSIVDEITLWTGQMWHTWLHDTLRRLGVPYMAEVNVNAWLPPGWGGTPDAVIWNPELKAFVLADFKTQKGEGMRYIAKSGAKDDHKAQASVYWHALKKMGLPLVKKIGVFYLPKNDTRSKDDVVEPILADFDPIPARTLHARMKHRRGRVSDYINSLPAEGAAEIEDWLTDELEPVQEREQRVYFDRASGYWDLKLVPHWSAAYCPFPNELCDCSTQGTTKLGFFDLDGEYIARKGFEDVEPAVTPPE